MNSLPKEIIERIKEFFPLKYLINVNKTCYNLYHKMLRISIINYDNYIRDTIRRDNEFVFEYILRENYSRWISIKKYIYKHMIFTNYFYFVIHYCVENVSDKCRSKLLDYIKERDLCKNIHKKNIVKYIKWRN